MGLSLGRCKELWGSYEPLFAAPLWFSKTAKPPHLFPFSASMKLIRFCCTNIFQLEKMAIPLFSFLFSFQTAPTIDRSWVAGWPIGGPAAPLRRRLPRPAIRQITHTELQTHHSHLYPSNLLLHPFHVSYFVPKNITWTMTPTCILPNLRPVSFQFFSLRYIFPAYHTRMSHWHSLLLSFLGQICICAGPLT